MSVGCIYFCRSSYNFLSHFKVLGLVASSKAWKRPLTFYRGTLF